MMEEKTFNTFRDIVYQNSGISLGDSKKAMVSARVAKRMRLLQLKDHRQYLKYLMNDSSGNEITKFLDVISTNVTSFFRESAHFELLESIVSNLIDEGVSRLRIWCAASSTGEEPYTIAMTILLVTGEKKHDIKILATDISTRVLEKAQSGRYESVLMEKVPQSIKSRFFDVQKEDNEKYFVAKKSLRDMIVFRRLNLTKYPFPMKGPLDIVFCRNVMIYFDLETRQKLVSEIYGLLRQGGYLFTGHAESLSGLKTDFKCLKPSVYQKI